MANIGNFMDVLVIMDGVTSASKKMIEFDGPDARIDCANLDTSAVLTVELPNTTDPDSTNDAHWEQMKDLAGNAKQFVGGTSNQAKLEVGGPFRFNKPNTTNAVTLIAYVTRRR